ncbi:uncharacterized protein LOC131606602 [Vicia villosa]|uniref:uncharacterized protein LOC131606602 n=1 Tax=Vicia villosa TaxID=3911 RepID=UPI00273C4FFC|nr:uncharacterized protein LOC131606602 [Vicia villosa]
MLLQTKYVFNIALLLLTKVLYLFSILSLLFYSFSTTLQPRLFVGIGMQEGPISFNFIVLRPIHWMCWDNVCKPREEGGLGVKNVEVMNLDLLSKCKWMILVDNEVVWRRILVARYGNIKLKFLIRDISVNFYARLEMVRRCHSGIAPGSATSRCILSFRSCMQTFGMMQFQSRMLDRSQKEDGVGILLLYCSITAAI